MSNMTGFGEVVLGSQETNDAIAELIKYELLVPAVLFSAGAVLYGIARAGVYAVDSVVGRRYERREQAAREEYLSSTTPQQRLDDLMAKSGLIFRDLDISAISKASEQCPFLRDQVKN